MDVRAVPADADGGPVPDGRVPGRDRAAAGRAVRPLALPRRRPRPSSTAAGPPARRLRRRRGGRVRGCARDRRRESPRSSACTSRPGPAAGAWGGRARGARAGRRSSSAATRPARHDGRDGRGGCALPQRRIRRQSPTTTAIRTRRCGWSGGCFASPPACLRAGPRDVPRAPLARPSPESIIPAIATPPRCTRTSALRISPTRRMVRPSGPAGAGPVLHPAPADAAQVVRVDVRAVGDEQLHHRVVDVERDLDLARLDPRQEQVEHDAPAGKRARRTGARSSTGRSCGRRRCGRGCSR